METKKSTYYWIGFALAAFLALLIVAIPMPVSASVESTKAEISTLENRIKDIQKNLTALDSKITSTRGAISSAKEYKTAIDEKLQLVAESIDTTERLIAAYDDQIAAKEQEIADMQGSIGAQYDELLTWMRLSYENSSVNYLQMILSSSNFEEFLSSVEMFKNMIEYQEKTMDSLNASLGNLREEEAALVVYRQEQQTVSNTLAAQQQNYVALQEESANYLKNLESSLAGYQSQSTSMTNTLAGYNKELQELNEQLEKELELLAQQNAVYVGGEFIWPVNAAKYKRISSQYGWRDLWGTQDFHLGIDIPCDYAADVWASNDGKVIKATSHYSYGNYVIIDHGGGITTLYAHNSKLLVQVGDVVKQGQVIAKAGSTGNSSGNHCHFEVRINGKTTQPLDYVTQPK